MSTLEQLSFVMKDNDDDQLDCFFCHVGGSRGRRCELFFIMFGQGRVECIGVHRNCVDWHSKRSQTVADAIERGEDDGAY